MKNVKNRGAGKQGLDMFNASYMAALFLQKRFYEAL
jgi:hypothetical protein